MEDDITRRKAAFQRFAETHPRYHGGFLADCFWNEASDVFGSIYIAERADHNDPRWDKVQEARDE